MTDRSTGIFRGNGEDAPREQRKEAFGSTP